MDKRFYNNKKDSSVLYLYNNGDECVDITGGWGIEKQSAANITITRNADNLEVQNHTSSGAWVYGGAGTNNKIDLSQWNFFNAEVELISGNNAQLAIKDIKGNPGRTLNIINSLTTGLQTYKVDLKAFQSHTEYVVVWMLGSKVRVHSIYLSKE